VKLVIHAFGFSKFTVFEKAMSSSDVNKAPHGFGMPQTAPNANSGLVHCTQKTEHDNSLTITKLTGSNLEEVRHIHIPKHFEYEAFHGSKDIVVDKSLKPQILLGKVVEPGQEQTGRWTREEHSSFLAALQKHGKEWKKVAAKVKTRTVVQTRTHAQKYFQKLQKGTGSDKIDLNGIEISTIAEVKKATPGSLKKKNHIHLKAPSLLGPAMSTQSQQVPTATQAAQLIAQLNQVKTHAEPPMLPKAPVYSEKYAVPETSMSDQYRRTNNKQGQHTLEDFSQTRRQGPSSGPSNPFYVPHTAMKIVAPKPEHTMMKNMFPEPSPAACGKRKLMEMDAAQMLADVAAGAGRNRRLEGAPSVDKSSYLAIGGEGGSSIENTNPLRIVKNKTTAVPTSVDKFGFGNLQIVNPEAFGVRSLTSRTNVSRFGQASPLTPWDGQLESLASEVKGKEANESEEVNKFKNDLITNSNDEEGHRNNHPLGNQKRTALHDAVCGGLLKEVTRMLKSPQSIGQGTDEIRRSQVCLTGSGGFAPLHSAAASLRMVDDAGNITVKEVTRMLESSQSIGQGSNEMRRSQVCLADSGGFAPLHSAASLRMVDDAGNMTAIRMTHLLLSADANVECLDHHGNTPLHWAARVGNSEVAQILILKNCALDLQNRMGETALHWAMRAGKIGMENVRVLLENGARSSLFSLDYKRALDVGVDGFAVVDQDIATSRRRLSTVEREKCGSQKSKEPGCAKKESPVESAETINEKRQTRANLLCHSPQARTLVLHHPECAEHVNKSETDWEAPDRISSVMNAVLQNNQSINTSVRDYEIQVSTDFERASLELLSRVHSAEYLTFVNDLSKELDRRRKARLIEVSQKCMDEGTVSKMFHDAAVVPFTPMVQRTMMRDSTVKKGAHSDTSFSSGSLRAARRAAGAVQHAVDRVLIGRNRNAFCVVRPPGHHAGVNGLLAGGESCGFCIFNNVAAGAMHALSDENHRPKCERCAIVDIDAHHGNGTEEIVRKCHDPGRLFFFSVHLYDNDKRKGKSNAYKFYPGTGDEDDVAHNIINVPIAPLWREKDAQQNVKPLVEKRHNTRNKSKQKAAAAAAASLPSDTPISSENEKETNACISKADGDSVMSNSSTSPTPPRQSPPHKSVATGRETYRRAIQQRLLPALRAFNPDLILISLGVDASRGDVGNARHYAGGKEAEGIDLEPEDYAWTTRKIMEVADICCQGRVISILEGGYGRTPTPTSESADSGDNKESNGFLDKTIFSQCAVRHLQALIDPYDAEMRSST